MSKNQRITGNNDRELTFYLTTLKVRASHAKATPDVRPSHHFAESQMHSSSLSTDKSAREIRQPLAAEIEPPRKPL